HTPVPSGHDRFDPDLVEEHLGPLRKDLGLSKQSFMALGRENPESDERFCMTVLGLKLSRRANAVSSLHGEVSRAMWTGLSPGKSEDMVPIGHITNGVHVPSWLAPQMFRLYDRELWETHFSLKSRMIEFVRRRAVKQAARRDEPRAVLQHLERVLSPDALTIGFARRFATYKR